MGGNGKLATLVGCNYANTKYELNGCINDVHAMHDLLIAHFGFKSSDIAVITDAVGSTALPTGANIRQALERMVSQAKDGDILFFHYSGHGTLIPSDKKPHHAWHKMDEAIVPSDFNLITDVDFRQIVDQLPTGAIFTMISDSCHSGGLIDKEKEQIGPSNNNNTNINISNNNNTQKHQHQPKFIPTESILSHLSSLSGLDSSHVGDHLDHLFGDSASSKFSSFVHHELPRSSSDNSILLSGCQSNETSADMSPLEGNGKAYGAFSNALQIVIKRNEGVVVSNKELVLGARQVLCELGFAGQHPCLYCSDENAGAAFLGQSDGVNHDK